MKVSARNQFKGTVLEIGEGAVQTKVRVDIGGGHEVYSVITLDALRSLDIKVGDEILVLIKSTDVMLGKD